MIVPFLDLKRQYLSIKTEIDQAIDQVIDTCAFAGGPFVEEFEKNFAEFCNSRYAVGVGSGTEAIWLTLLALGIGPGDEIITVPNTFIATAEAISLCGASPVFVDIDETTYTMDPDLLMNAITPKTRAIIPVHIFGQMADMDPIMEIAQSKGLFVIEDACQAHGSTYKDRSAGSIGDAGCFSFYPGKNLGAYGEAGAVVTSNSDLAGRISNLRDHGQSKRYYHKNIGCNSRMDGIQAAVLNTKLKYLSSWNSERRLHAHRYNRLLGSIDGVLIPKETDFNQHVYHIYAIRVKNRSELLSAFTAEGVQFGIHYPVPIHLQEAYHNLNLTRGIFPVSEICAEEFVSLPIFPELSGEQADYVASVIKSVCQ